MKQRIDAKKNNRTNFDLQNILSAIQVLLEHGADINAQDGRRETPLHCALSRGDPQISRLLVEHGADVNAKDYTHTTPLHLASLNAPPAIAPLLIEQGADINAKDITRNTPLLLALSLRDLQTLLLLLEHIAHLDAQNTAQDHTPIAHFEPSWVRDITETGSC